MPELWRDRWCFSCHGLRRFMRNNAGVWQCRCGTLATSPVARDLDRAEPDLFQSGRAASFAPIKGATRHVVLGDEQRRKMQEVQHLMAGGMERGEAMGKVFK